MRRVVVVLLALIALGCASDPVEETPTQPPPVPAVDVEPTGPDPRFVSCGKAIDEGYGPYTTDDPEYQWYRDSDGDGFVCEGS